MSGHRLEILPLSRHRWVVRYDGDPTPLTESPTLADARAEARNWARQFGEREIAVHELDGEFHVEEIDPDFRAPTPADVKGPHVEP
jgi:2-polyprenyl-6-methoxyphenol hydroxylase-like FAD-dependent oxidoreductase